MLKPFAVSTELSQPSPPDDVEAVAGLAAPAEMRLWLRLSAAHALLEARLRGRLRQRFDTTPARYDTMALLDKSAEGMTMGELSKRLMVSNGNITGIVERLVRDGKATRTPLPHDRRTHVIRLTAAGNADVRNMEKAHQAWLAEFMGGLEREELSALLSLLDRLKHAVRQGGKTA